MQNLTVSNSKEGRRKAGQAKEQPKYMFRDLRGMFSEQMLQWSWREIRKDAAYGVDRESANDYEEHLMENIHKLVEQLKRNFYHAKLVRRQYIPKGEGKMRALGIPTTQDKLLQLAAKKPLEAIYEQEFLPCSYGYRPNTGAKQAVIDLSSTLQFVGIHPFPKEHFVSGEVIGM